jgi:hypothetical protein
VIRDYSGLFRIIRDYFGLIAIVRKFVFLFLLLESILKNNTPPKSKVEERLNREKEGKGRNKMEQNSGLLFIIISFSFPILDSIALTTQTYIVEKLYLGN